MTKFFNEWKWYILGFLVIVAIALFIRVFNLTILPVFADEAIYIRWAQVMRAEPTLRFLPLSDGKQPLFMWLIIPFLKVFSDPLYAGRFTSVVAGLGTLVGIFILSFYLFKSKKVALISSLLYSLSPFSVFFDRMALVDSLLGMFGVWTLLLGTLAARTLRLDFAMLTGFSLGGALLTKSPALFFVLLLPATWVLSNWPKERSKMTLHSIKLALLFLVSTVIGYAMYNVLRLGPNFNMIAQRNIDYVYPLDHFITSPLDPLLPFIDRTFEWLWILGPSVLLVLVVFGIFLSLRKFPKEALLLCLWLLAPIFVQAEFAKVFTARYVLFSLPYIFILAGSSFLSNKALVTKVLTILLIFFIFHSLKINYLLLTEPEKANLPRSERSGYLEEWTAGTGIKEIADFLILESKKDPSTKIVVGTEGYFGTLPDGLQIYMEGKPGILVIGVGLALDHVPNPLVESKLAGNRTFLLANNTRLFARAEDLGLEITAAYPKAVRPDGSREVLLLMEVTDATLSPKNN